VTTPNFKRPQLINLIRTRISATENGTKSKEIPTKQRRVKRKKLKGEI
jgi:hypothetical protein